MSTYSRRHILSTGIAMLALSAKELHAIKSSVVNKLDVFRIPVNRRGNWLLIKVTTADGLTGIGDASHGGHDDETLRELQTLFEVIRNRPMGAPEQLRSQATEFQSTANTARRVAQSALEQCFWDIQGKVLSVPVYQMFGGAVRQSIRNYANINRSTEDRSPEGFGTMAERAVKDGFDAIKLAPFDDMPPSRHDPALLNRFTDLGVARAAAVRSAIGPNRDLLIDAHSHFDLPRGLKIAHLLAPLNLYWLEEVTPAEPLENLAAINRDAPMPTAGGESVTGVTRFYEYITAKAVDIVMPDVKVCGGMWEMKKIAAIAEGAGLTVSPHGPASPVGNVAAAHISATMPNFNILELAYGEVPWRSDLIEPAEALINGRLDLSNRPGLGIVLNNQLLKKYVVS